MYVHIYMAQSAGTLEYTDCKVCVGYDIKQSDGEAPVMLKLLGIQRTSSLSLLASLLGPLVVAPDRVLSMGQIELFDI